MLAINAISAGSCRYHCSDYHPASILHAVFKLSQECLSLPEAVAMASLNPARALSLSGLGSLTEGNKGDVIVANMRCGRPVATAAAVDGVPVYSVRYRYQDTGKETYKETYQEKAG